MNSKVKLGISFAIILGVIVSSNPNFNWSFLSGQDPNPDKTVSQDNSLESETLNLGFFPNLNHAQVIIGIGNGNFNKSLTSNEEHKNITFNPHVFSSGPSLMNALYSGQLDVAYVGPDSIIDGYILFGGNEFRIISGASSGGASFVVRNDLGIETVDDLGGKKFATPQLGNTQDVALRSYLVDNGYNTVDNGGNVTVVALEPGDIVSQFKNKEIDGAWVPEPVTTILTEQANGKVFVDERDLWPDGKFVTTNIIVRTDYLRENPDVIKKLLEAHVDETLWINEKLTKTNNIEVDNNNDEEAKPVSAAFNKGLMNITGKTFPDNLLKEALSRIDFTFDPFSNTLVNITEDANDLGFISMKSDWNKELLKLYDLTLLNEVLSENGLEKIKSFNLSK